MSSYLSAGSSDNNSSSDIGDYDYDDPFMAPSSVEDFDKEQEEEEGNEVAELLRDLRPDERDPPPRSRKQTTFFQVDYASADPGHEEDMKELHEIEEEEDDDEYLDSSSYQPSTDEEDFSDSESME